MLKRYVGLYVVSPDGRKAGKPDASANWRTGNLVGTVSDATDAVIAGAKVSVVNVDTNFVTETATSTLGSYNAPFLAPGTYRLTVEGPGFSRHVREGILVRAGDTQRLDVQLAVGMITDSVTVSGAQPLLETETSSSGHIYSGTELVKMPIAQKVAPRMLYYYPGTNFFRVMGQRQNMLGFTVDGINGKEPGIQSFGGTDTQATTTLDAMEEVKVYTSGTPAEYGHSAGGLMSITFRSGTNQYHGSFEHQYLGGNQLHREYLEQARNTNPFAYQLSTGTFLGPVLLPKYNGRNKTFWLFGFSRQRQTGATTNQSTTVPTPAMYNGDFSFNGQTSPSAAANLQPVHHAPGGHHLGP